MTLINLDNASSLYGHIESVQFRFTNADSGYFDAVSAETQEELARRIRDYLVRNANYATGAGAIRYVANYFATMISNSNIADIEEKSKSGETLYSINVVIHFEEFKDFDITINFVTAANGTYLSIKNHN